MNSVEIAKRFVRVARRGFGFANFIEKALDTAEVRVKSPFRRKVDDNVLAEEGETDQATASDERATAIKAAKRLANTLVGPKRKSEKVTIKDNIYQLPWNSP